MCNTNKCPVGVATQDPKLSVGLVVNDKKIRVANFHKGTVHSFVELLGASGLDKKENITRAHIYRRISFQSMLTYEEIFTSYKTGEFLTEIPERYAVDFKYANANAWGFSNIGSWSE